MELPGDKCIGIGGCGGLVHDNIEDTLHKVQVRRWQGSHPVRDGDLRQWLHLTHAGCHMPSTLALRIIDAWRSCEPNVGVAGNVVFVAMRDIAAGDELTTDYALFDDYDGEMVCECGRPSCRRIVNGRDWQRPELQAKYAGYFSWYLQQKFPRHLS